MKYPIIIVGAGATGIGLGVLLKQLNLSFIIVDQGRVGESFLTWPFETQFISPSFSGNAFGSVDLNAITPDTSPAFSLLTEHPTGYEYAKYLRALVDHYQLPLKLHTKINNIKVIKGTEDSFELETDSQNIQASYVIWAAGEFHYPNDKAFLGSEACIHYSEVDSWSNFDGNDFAIIGAYESGVDAAYQLAKLGKKVTIFDGSNQIQKHGSDSSYNLSPFSRDRLRQAADYIKVIDQEVEYVEEFIKEGYSIGTANGEKYWSFTKPFDCTGFASSLNLVSHLFEFENGNPKLNSFDESTICSNLFLAGPQVRHGQALFCFIYKFRQRFGILGEVLSERLGGDKVLRDSVINYYKQKQFYLDDLSCCDDECRC